SNEGALSFERLSEQHRIRRLAGGKERRRDACGVTGGERRSHHPDRTIGARIRTDYTAGEPKIVDAGCLDRTGPDIEISVAADIDEARFAGGLVHLGRPASPRDAVVVAASVEHVL